MVPTVWTTQHSRFGDTGVKATTTNEVDTSVYASIDESDPNHVVLVAINKSLAPMTATIDLDSSTSFGAAKTYTLTSAAATPQPGAGLEPTGSDVYTYTMPAQSVSVIVPAVQSTQSAADSARSVVAATGRPGSGPAPLPSAPRRRSSRRVAEWPDGGQSLHRDYVDGGVATCPPMPSSASLRDVKAHEVPTWWRDAKLGIFVHWTPASVPAFAPVDSDMAGLMAGRDPEAMAWSPYVEWYQNSMRFARSPVARHHAEEQRGRSYYEFGPEWEAALHGWDPDEWAERFAAAGARYVVLVAKHHDGFCLWPTGVENPHRPGWNCRRDVVGELAEAVRARGLKFGLYYSGGLDWTFNDRPIGSFSDLLLAQPRGAYVAYAEAQVRELIDRYKPTVLWNDISWPAPARRLAELLTAYYRAVPDGAVNDRFMPRSALWRLAATRPARQLLDRAAARSAAADAGIIPPRPPMFDFRTPEYTVFPEARSRAWECVRGIDRSFGYNAESSEQDFIPRDELLWSLIDIVAKGGNLLLNVGPRGEDAAIAPAQLARLDWLAEFMSKNGTALYGTRPWVHTTTSGATWEARYAGGGLTATTGSPVEAQHKPLPVAADGGVVPADGEPVSAMAGDDAVSCFVRPVAGADPVETVTLREVRAGPDSLVASAAGRDLRCERGAAGLTVWLDEPATATAPGVFVLRNVTAGQ